MVTRATAMLGTSKLSLIGVPARRAGESESSIVATMASGTCTTVTVQASDSRTRKSPGSSATSCISKHAS